MKTKLLFIVIMLSFLGSYSQTYLTVTKTTDPDPFDHPFNAVDSLCDPEMFGTLQWAIRKINSSLDSLLIVNFNIPGSGTKTIELNFEFPMILNNSVKVLIDGTSQSGYTYGTPKIIIDGKLSIGSCIQTYNTNISIKGIYIKNFLYHGIVVNTPKDSSYICDNIIENIKNGEDLTATIGIRVMFTGTGGTCNVYGNQIGTRSDTTSIEDYGMMVMFATGMKIGGTNLYQTNVLTNCGSRGICLVGSNNILMSGNYIYNNPEAIFGPGSNNNIQPPIIDSLKSDTLFGKSGAGNKIEFFGSTGSQQANVYLGNTITDSIGNWQFIYHFSMSYTVATATDVNNNTSILSNPFYVPPFPCSPATSPYITSIGGGEPDGKYHCKSTQVCVNAIGGTPFNDGNNDYYLHSWSTNAGTGCIGPICFGCRCVDVSCPGTYYVTVTDAHGCVASTSYILSQAENANPHFDVTNISPAGCGECNGSITLSADNIYAPYYYAYWDVNNPIEMYGSDYIYSDGEYTFSNLCPGEYTFEIQDAYDCIYCYTVEIPTATSYNLSITTDGFCRGEEFEFTAQSIPYSSLTSYNWDIDDNGTVDGQGQTFDYLFDQPGYHPVKLTIYSCHTTSTITQYFYVAPQDDNANLNKGCCVKEINWFPDPVEYTYVYYQNDVYLASSTTTDWDFGPTEIVYVKNTLHIQPGQTLNISNGTIVSFGPQGNIDIAPGGTLYLSDGAMLTGTCTIPYDKESEFPPQCECRNMWEGIRVRGINQTAQFPMDLTHTGRLFINEAIIKDAHIAVLAGNISFPYGGGTSSNPYSWTSKNGYIDVKNCIFLNNGIDIKFLDFIPPANYTSSIKKTNFSKIQYNSFITQTNIFGDNLIDNGYKTGNSYTYPNQFNPYYGYANSQGRTTRAIDLLQQKFFYALNYNTFENIENAIVSFDAAYNVLNSSFNNVARSIFVNNISTNIFNAPHQFVSNTFKTASNRAIEIQSGLNDYIKGNDFGDMNYTTTQSENPYCIALNSCSNLKINDNSFYLVRWGIGFNDLSSGASSFGYESSGNQFSRTQVNIIGSGNNSAIQTKCNNSYNPYPADYSGTNWAVLSTVFADQGQPPIPGEPFNVNTKRPAGNKFSSSNYKEIGSNIPFTYYHHSDADRTPDILNSSPIVLYDNNVAFDVANPANSCLSSTSGSSASVMLSLYQDELNALPPLESQYDSLTMLLDHGETAYLLSIIDTTGEQALKDTLLADSPLSDKVIVTTALRENPLSPAILKDILVANCPVSNSVWTEISSIINSFPDSIALLIKEAQGFNPTITTLTSIQRQMDFHTLNAKEFVRDIVNYYMNADSTDTAFSFLQTVPFMDATMVVTSSLAEDSLTLHEALVRIKEFQPSDEAQQDWQTLQEIYMNLKKYGKSLLDIDSVDLSNVWNIANKNNYYAAIANARSYLYLLYGIEFLTDTTFELNMIKRGYYYKESNKTALYVLYPNPSDGNITLSTLKGDFDGSESILITDVLGKTVYKKLISKDCNVHKISLTLPNGIYLCKLYKNNNPVFEKTIVIQK